jgi:hypothetical protein
LAYPDGSGHGAAVHGATRPAEPVWVPRPDIGTRARRSSDAWARPVHGADVAQARIFETILLSEIAELDDLAASAETGWLRRCERGIDRPDHPPEALLRLRGRVSEAQRLLNALRARFLPG